MKHKSDCYKKKKNRLTVIENILKISLSISFVGLLFYLKYRFFLDTAFGHHRITCLQEASSLRTKKIDGKTFEKTHEL